MVSKIYLAARYSRIDELNFYKRELAAWGHVVTSRWLNGEHEAQEREIQHGINGGADYPDIGALFAKEDVEDLLAADVVISFSEKPRSEHSRGGRHVEFGMALALGKRLIVIGPRENVFHWVPAVEHWPHWTAFTAEKWAGLMKVQTRAVSIEAAE